MKPKEINHNECPDLEMIAKSDLWHCAAKEREIVAIIKMVNLAIQRMPAVFLDDRSAPALSMISKIFPLFSDTSMR